MKFEEDDDFKRNNPFTAGEDHRPPELVVKKLKNGGGGPAAEDLDLMTKPDSEIRETIERYKKNLLNFGNKLPDKGENIKLYLQRYEDEIERRNKFQSNKKDSTTSSPDRVAQDKPSDGVDAQVNEVVDLELVMKTESEIRETIAKHTKNLQILGDKLPDKGKWIKAALCRHEDELGRRKLQLNKKDSTASSPDRVAGNKPSE